MNWGRLLSHDLPRSRWLALALVIITIGLAAAPFMLDGIRALSVAAKIIVFIVLVASFDLLLGYTGIVSFAHTMFFGIGAYGVAIAMSRLGPHWSSLLLGVVLALLLSGVLSLIVGLFSLRVRAIFFAMITLAVASAFQTLASQLSQLTGGEDGLTYKLPAALMPSTEYFEHEIFGIIIDGRVLTYYLLFIAGVLMFLAMLRLVNSPFGRVLQAVRENEFRAEALGYRVVVFRTLSSVWGSLFATMAGVLYAIWLRYNGPDTTLSFEVMVDVLLIAVIGGLGSLYGAMVGSALFLVAQSYLQDLLTAAGQALHFIPFAPELLAADRWLLWLGVLFVLSVHYFPNGIVGHLREWAWNRQHRNRQS